MKLSIIGRARSGSIKVAPANANRVQAKLDQGEVVAIIGQRDEFYKKRSGGKVEPVLEAAKRYRENTLLEVTNLIIPGQNDSDEDISELRDWIADNLGADTPVHMSAYFPRFKLRAKPTRKNTTVRNC